MLQLQLAVLTDCTRTFFTACLQADETQGVRRGHKGNSGKAKEDARVMPNSTVKATPLSSLRTSFLQIFHTLVVVRNVSGVVSGRWCVTCSQHPPRSMCLFPACIGLWHVCGGCLRDPQSHWPQLQSICSFAQHRMALRVTRWASSVIWLVLD